MGKEKIIITGGCGFIGSHTTVSLLEEGFEVVIIDNLSNSNQIILDGIKSITNQEPIFEKVDLSDYKTTKKVFAKHKDAKAVIHFAAHKAVQESVKKPLKYYQNNLFSLVNVLLVQEKLKINKFIFSSSATVYGETEKLPITEDNQTQRPFSPYGNTKKIAEEIIEDVVLTNKEFKSISLRYFNPIGAHKSGLIGELPTGTPNNLMPYITQTAVGIREKLTVFGNDYPTKDGTPIRDYIHVMDLADAHLKALLRLLKNEQTESLEFYNLGTGKGYSVLEIIETFKKINDVNLKYEISKRRPGDVPKLFASNVKAKTKLNWQPQKSLEQMVSSSWKWEQYIREKLKV